MDRTPSTLRGPAASARRPEAARFRRSAVALLATLCFAAACAAPESGPVGNTELNVVVPNGAPGLGGGSSAPDLIDIQSVEYTVNCLGNGDTFLENNASFPSEVRLEGNLEVVDGRTNPGGNPPDFGPVLPGDASEVWQAFMDLPPGPCTVQLRARDGDGEVICTATESFAITADTTTKVNLILVCDVSFQAPVGMLDVDATFSFVVSNFCPDLFVLNCLDSAPQEQIVAPPPIPPVAATTCEVRFRDGDSTCGQSCDPQSCVVTPEGLDCAPGPDPGVSTTVTCVDDFGTGQIDCDFNPLTTETECTFNGDTLGATPVGGPLVPNAPGAGAFVAACTPPALGGPAGAILTCTAVTTDGDEDCNKVKVVSINCPAIPPCGQYAVEEGFAGGDAACQAAAGTVCQVSTCNEGTCDGATAAACCENVDAPDGTDCSAESPPLAECLNGVCSGGCIPGDPVCDDGNPCTTGIECTIFGTCDPQPVPDGTACDDGLGPDSGSCQAGVCAPICDTTVCPPSGVPCFTNTCDPADGSCSIVADADGAACDPPGGAAGSGTCVDSVCTSPTFAEFCFTPLAPDEPLCNPTYDDTLWPGSHRGAYAQASNGGPGVEPASVVTPDHFDLPGAPIMISFTEPYPDGGRAAWASVLGLDGAIVKVDADTFQLVDDYIPANEEPSPPIIPLGLSGAYAAIDSDGNFIAGRSNFMSVFGDSVPGDRFSPIELQRRVFFLPNQAMCNTSDLIAGMALTYDDHIAFATELGNVFVIPVDAEQGDVVGSIPVISTNPNCATADPSTLETVSNNIAIDEDGGIYVVTSAAQYRFDWDGTSLTQAWRVEYDSDPNVSPIRLGPGSGQTPSLMGTRDSDDKFVVIADGQQLMNLLLIWRDEIPPGWVPIAPGRDPRIACEVPIQFGNPAITEAISEQSIAIRGYSAIVVNDVVDNPTIVPGSPIGQNLASALEGGIPAKAPVGMERVDWDPVAQTCATVWANSTVSIPNGIPSISDQSNLVYGIGQRGGQFGVEGLDFDTGASVLWAPGTLGTCDPALIAPARIIPAVDTILDTEIIPGSGVTVADRACENSVYAATIVGPDAAIWTGSFFGMSKYSPDAVAPASASVQARAGIDQALDLLDRTLAALGTAAARDFAGRAYVQTTGAIPPAQLTGPPAAVAEMVSAAASISAAFTQIEAAQDPTAIINAAITSLQNADALLN